MENSSKIRLPAWYKTERETGSTISKLVDSKELSFYLNNPDPFIRRLAILRLGQLKRKDSYVLLNGILDDQLESEENRNLAALLMQKLNHELNLGFFISNSYLSRYTGEEDLDQLLSVRFADSFPDISFHFENELIESQLNFDNEFLKSNLDEKADEFPFSVKDWLAHCSAGILLDIKKGLIGVLRFLFIGLPKKIFGLFAAIPKRIAERKESRSEPDIKDFDLVMEKSKTRSFSDRSPREYHYRPPFSSRMKSALRKVLNILLFPFRFIFHFKWPILAALAVIYCLLSFTEAGRLYLFRSNPKAYYLNVNFLNQTKITAIKLINKSETLSSVFKTSTAIPPEPKAVVEKTVTKLTVTAPKGLYLRGEPSSTGEKLVLMKQGTVVEFMDEKKQDSAGDQWSKVKMSDGTTGWANAKWLGEVSK